MGGINEEFNLTIEIDEGIIKKEKYVTGTIITLDIPKKEGYTLTGWEVISGNGVVSGNKFTMGTNDTYIKAIWTPTIYTITYNLDGGIVNGTNPTSLNYGESITLIEPEKEGYTFTGWTTTSGTLVENLFTMGSADAYIEAMWTPTIYTITFNLDGGSGVSNRTYTIETPSKTNYTFKGWTGNNGTTPSKTVTITKGETGDKEYTANWYVTTLYIYKSGSEYTDVTGGIKALQWVGGSYGSPTATVTKNSKNIVCTATRGSSDGYHSFAAIYTAKKISLEDYKKLVVTFNSITTEGYVSVFSQKPTDNSTGRLKALVTTTKTTTLNISSLDAGYIVIGARTRTETTTSTHSVNIASIYLE